MCDETDDGAGRVLPVKPVESYPAVMAGEPPALLTLYFLRRRDVLIQELRELDRLLGRPQTVPERNR